MRDNEASASPLYDRIGTGYDGTRRPDPRIADRLALHLNLSPDATYVDVACGTGNYTVLLASRGARWIGIDQSSQMLHMARRKSKAVLWCRGDVTALPLGTGVADGVVCTLAIHHFPDLEPAFAEVGRILARGWFVLFTATPEQMRGYWLNKYFPTAMIRSIEQMPAFPVVERALTAAGFCDIRCDAFEVPPDLTDLFLYSGKHRPGLYLQENVRRGISTFASLADPLEVASGLEQLRSDIATGRIEEVIRKYVHTGGDYLFVVARKRRV
jgi:ubiquinone/menaquinone biosynthesis C-methylase UbiE